MQELMFEIAIDYYVPVLRILADMPSGMGRKQEVLAELDRRYGARIPPEHRGTIAWDDHVLTWAHYASCGRRDMVRAGYMANPEHGTWQITSKGRQWLADHPAGSNIDLGGSDSERTSRSNLELRTKRASDLPANVPSLATLEQTRQIMGDEQFRPLWGTLYDQLVAAEQARTISDISNAELAHNAQQQVRRIQKYLQGQSDDHPQAEQLCDWAHFCYQLALYREVAALYALINGGDVNPWYLERTRKIAVASKARL